MSNEARWHDLGSVEELSRHRLRQITIGRTRIALTFKDGRFGAISGACNHAGGPLGEGITTATTSSAPGTTGSSTAGPARGNPASSRTACRATSCGKRGDGSGST